MDDVVSYVKSFMTIFVFFEFFSSIFVFGIIFTAIMTIIKRKSNTNFFKSNVVINKNNIDKYKDITKTQLSEFNTDDLNAFKDYFYKIFIDFENAYNNLDYDLMRTLSTKQLFQNYYTGITLDLKKGNKRIINNIEKKHMIIYEAHTSTTQQIVSAMIEISYNSYTINKNGNIEKGNRIDKINEKFEVIFRKDFEEKEIVKCPNCGATVISDKCEYCRTKVKNNEFRISNIQKIIE